MRTFCLGSCDCVDSRSSNVDSGSGGSSSASDNGTRSGDQSTSGADDGASVLLERRRSGSSLTLLCDTSSGQGSGRDGGGDSNSLGGGSNGQERRAVRLERGRDDGRAGRSNVARVSGLTAIGLVGEGVRESDGVLVAVASLTSVDCVRRSPGLVVHGAALLENLAVLVQDVGVEEIADLVELTSGGGVSASIVGLLVASNGAEVGIEYTASDLGGANERVITSAVKRSVDGRFAEEDTSVVASRGGDGLVNVSVGSSDYDLELVAPLAGIVGIVGSNRA